MTLGNLLSLDQIIPEMQAHERWSAIVELVDLLVAKGQINPQDRDVVLGALRAREETMSTGIGFGCVIDIANDAAEISLDENVTREDLHPADQFERFRELSEDRGWGAEEIAARLSVIAHVVKQRMRLGAVSPKLLQVHRDGELTLDQLMAFAI